MHRGSSSALHLDCGDLTPNPNDEVDLQGPVTPIIKFTVAGSGCIGEMRPHRRLNESPPKLMVAPGLCKGEPANRRRERGVEHLKLWALTARARGISRVFLQAAHHTGAGE